VLPCSVSACAELRACAQLEHEDSDMMRPLRTCAPSVPGSDECLQPKCLSPLSAVLYDPRTGFSAV
jgi:hypothetical protein